MPKGIPKEILEIISAEKITVRFSFHQSFFMPCDPLPCISISDINNNLAISCTLRKYAYSNILKILPPKTEKFQIKNFDIFHIYVQNRYSLEPPRPYGSNEYPQSIF